MAMLQLVAPTTPNTMEEAGDTNPQADHSETRLTKCNLIEFGTSYRAVAVTYLE